MTGAVTMLRHLAAIGVFTAIAVGAYALTEFGEARVEELPTADASYAGLEVTPPEPVRARTLTREFAQQTFGTLCETPDGACTVSPQPINSPCQCGSSYGRIVR
jgi:hypothetical protein